MISIAITGGIGSGKTYVSNLLQELGVPIYNTDNEAKRLMLSDEGIRRDLITLLGTDVYRDGVLNKPMLVSFLFADSENAARINGIVHPRVKDDFRRWLECHADYEIVGLESAILYEAGFEDVVDVVVMIYAPEALRIERAMKRDQATEAQIRERMAAQMDDEYKRSLADYVIYTDGTIPLDPQLSRLLTQLKSSK
ncbi:MAG: dephospho-CoA kinase [Bacteroides sp.]|nr:dephospho-CoA kinase [Bacteroides sp.]